MFINVALVSAVGFIVSGCNQGYPAVDSKGLLMSLEKSLEETGVPAKTSLQAPLNIETYPLLQEVCNNEFNRASYEYDGQMMRTRLVKFGYKMPVGDSGMIYRHEMAACFTFHPVKESERQEAVYVKYLATIDASAAEMLSAIKQVPGGINGLLLDSGFHIDAAVTENGWSEIENEKFLKESSRVQYLKMNPIEMKAVNKFDAEKYKDLLAFEMISVNVTRVGGVLQIADTDIAIFENAMN
jgi:hypothetical protein